MEWLRNECDVEIGDNHKESRQRLMDIAVENLRAFLPGEPVNVVNQ
jgi:lactate dehydrogenase-like 2-hydroxyacid dehydrogenase